ncbi:TIGR01906 family membrane protein [Ligilactobacillus araffinosus]|nr:TIGR01906 family membrane protein [Ligilactobacillus araffinosus]
MKKNNLILLRDMITIGIAIISLSVFITVNFTGLYHFFVVRDHLGRLVGLSNYELMINYRYLISYLQCGWIHHWQTSLALSSKGLTHFADVKRLIEFNNLILILFGGLAGVVITNRVRKRQMWQLILPVKMALTLLGTFIFILMIAFNRIFILFHEVLFRNRDWIFNPQTDPIIKALPENFFEACFLWAFLVWILAGLGLIWYGKRELKKAR